MHSVSGAQGPVQLAREAIVNRSNVSTVSFFVVLLFFYFFLEMANILQEKSNTDESVKPVWRV
jgi:hypothetical protein